MRRLAAAILVLFIVPGLPASQGTPVKVVAHTPGQDEAGVRLTTPIRVQFSAGLDRSTLEGRISLAYSAEDSRERGEPEPPAIAYEIEYTAGDHTLVVRPVDGWLRFREVRFALGEGVRGVDGALVEPFALTFMTGG